MRDRFLSFSPPDITAEEIEEVLDTLRSGWLTSGPRVRRFEESFAGYVGADSALGLSSGTAALHVALLASGIGPGNAVVVPTMTFASAAHVVEHVGATPVLVDVDPASLNIDPAAVRRAIETSDLPVRAVLPVHLHGQPCDLGQLLEIAEGNDLTVIDDAAHALPTQIGDQTIGGSRHERVLTAFSFYATKNLTMGEGGALTGPEARVNEAKRWILHGMTQDAWGRNEDQATWRYDVDRAGFKYNLSDVQAALGLVQLRRLPEMHARRREIADAYGAAFDGLAEIQAPCERPGTRHSWHIYAIRLELGRLTIARDRFIDELRLRNIGASVHFIPIHSFSYYRKRYGYRSEDFPVASREFERLVSLPIHPGMTPADVEDVIVAATDVIGQHRR